MTVWFALKNGFFTLEILPGIGCLHFAILHRVALFVFIPSIFIGSFVGASPSSHIKGLTAPEQNRAEYSNEHPLAIVP